MENLEKIQKTFQDTSPKCKKTFETFVKFLVMFEKIFCSAILGFFFWKIKKKLAFEKILRYFTKYVKKTLEKFEISANV